MKKHIALAALLFAVCGAFLCGTTQAQCSIDTSGYDSYDSEAVDSTGTHVLVTVEIDGTASMDATCGDPSSITHTPQIVTNWGSNQGDPVCANCYLTFQSPWDSGALSTGEEVTFSYNSSVICSAAGTIWLFSSGGFSVERAETLSQTTGGTSGQWTVTPYCTPATTPPDYAPNYAPESASSPYWLQKAICKNNSGSPNGVFCLPTTETAKPAPQARYACTKKLQ